MPAEAADVPAWPGRVVVVALLPAAAAEPAAAVPPEDPAWVPG